MTAVVRIEQLKKTYPMGDTLVHALAGVDLTIERGESVAIMGPSGSGKSTLMHLLGCLDLPTSGRYWLNGTDVSTLDDTALSLIRAERIGFVFQSFNLIPQLTVYENVEVPFSYRNKEVPGRDEKIRYALSRVKMDHRLHHLPRELSGGEMQRVAIARALAIDPVILLADEPTGNLDSVTEEAILDLFDSLNAQGVTLIVVTHDENVGSRCRRLVKMRDGKIRDEVRR